MSNNNANNIISNNDFANAGDIRFLECDLTTAFAEFTFVDTTFQIHIDNTPSQDEDDRDTQDIDIKFTSAQTKFIRIPAGSFMEMAPYRHSSIFIRAVTGAFKVNVRYNLKGSQTLV